MATEDRESSKGDSPIFVGRKLGQSPDGERELRELRGESACTSST